MKQTIQKLTNDYYSNEGYTPIPFMRRRTKKGNKTKGASNAKN